VAAAGLTRADGTSHRADFDRVNDTVAGVHAQVLQEITQRFDPTADDVAVGPIPEAAPVLFKKWRANAWHNAERLVAAQTTQERADVATSIEQESEAVGRSIRKGTRYDDPAKRAARDAWCAQHGGQRPAAYRPGPATLRLRRKTVPVTETGQALVRIACPAPSLGCRGGLAILRGRRTLGHRRYALAAGQVRVVGVAVRDAPSRAVPVVVRLTRARASAVRTAARLRPA
jgi:hypothetical protein